MQEFTYSLTIRHLEGRVKGREKESKNLKETKTAITQRLFFKEKKIFMNIKNIFEMAINTSVLTVLQIS